MIKFQKRIAIIGEQCAGKTTVAKLIRAQLNYNGNTVADIKFADPIYGALRALKKDKHRAFMQDFGEMAKVHFGELVFVDIFKERIGFDFLLYDVVLCDDIRRDYEAQACEELGFNIVYVFAPEELRRQRAKDQGLEFITNHISETEVPKLVKYSSRGIVNDSDLENTRAQVRALIKTWYSYP